MKFIFILKNIVIKIFNLYLFKFIYIINFNCGRRIQKDLYKYNNMDNNIDNNIDNKYNNIEDSDILYN